jgi:hypothetical protein
MDIDGIKVTVTGDPYPGEIEGYVRRGLREHGKRLTAMEITLDGADKTKEFCMMANQCVHCGQEMPEGDQVCGHCRRQHGY